MRRFHELCPATAERETRSMAVFDDGEIPAGVYSFVDFYCDELGCDCRRSVVQVWASKTNQIVATLNYGWESADFYRKWCGGAFEDDMLGVSIEPFGHQSELSYSLLDMFVDLLENDPEYASRFPRHYYEFKAALKARSNVPFVTTERRYEKRKRQRRTGGQRAAKSRSVN